MLVNVCRPVGAFGVHPPELRSLSVSFYTSTIVSLAFRSDAERAHHLAMDQAWFTVSFKISCVLIERDGLRHISDAIAVNAA
jgi:hypothetical protein